MSPIPQTQQPIFRPPNVAPQTESRVDAPIDDNEVAEKFSGLVKALNSKREKTSDQSGNEKQNLPTKAVSQPGTELAGQGKIVELAATAIEQKSNKAEIAMIADAAISTGNTATPITTTALASLEKMAKDELLDPQPGNQPLPEDNSEQQAAQSGNPVPDNVVRQNTPVADEIVNKVNVQDLVAIVGVGSVAVSNSASAIIAGGSADKPLPRQRPSNPANAELLTAKQDKPISQLDSETQIPLKALAESGRDLTKRTAGPPKDLPGQATPKSQVELVAVTDSRVEKHYPADTVQQAWQQIGKKLVQELVSTTSNQNKPGPPAMGNSGETLTNSAKTIKHLTIQLKPENLGTVDVKLSIANGGLEVTLSATDRHLAGRLLRNADSLSSQLKSAGFSFDKLSVQFADFDSSQPARAAGNLANGDGNQTLNGQNNQRQSQTPETAFGNSKEQKSGQNSDEQSNYEKNETLLQSADVDGHRGGSIFI